MEKEVRQTDEEVAIQRAIQAGKMKRSLNPAEQAMLETFPEHERVAVLVFVRWCEGQKWNGGPQAKLAAKSAFIQAFRIAEALYKPLEEKKSPLVLA